MSSISTHVLDTSRGKPATGVPVSLQKASGEQWEMVAHGITNEDGRIPDLHGPKALSAGRYQMTFDTKTYFDGLLIRPFYPVVHVNFEITEGQHYHIPLLLSPFGYSTYRGS